MDLNEPGVGDFVLLDSVDEETFMKNLEERFLKDRIYVFFFPSFLIKISFISYFFESSNEKKNNNRLLLEMSLFQWILIEN